MYEIHRPEPLLSLGRALHHKPNLRFRVLFLSRLTMHSINVRFDLWCSWSFNDARCVLMRLPIRWCLLLHLNIAVLCITALPLTNRQTHHQWPPWFTTTLTRVLFSTVMYSQLPCKSLLKFNFCPIAHLYLHCNQILHHLTHAHAFKSRHRYSPPLRHVPRRLGYLSLWACGAKWGSKLHGWGQ